MNRKKYQPLSYFDGKRFQNVYHVPLFGEYIDPYADRRVEGPAIPEGPFNIQPFKNPKITENELGITWFGHSSFLARMKGKNILFDPVFNKYASPVPVKMLRRYIGETVRVIELPEIDLVCISHCHYDHLDKTTIKKLKNKVKHFVVPYEVGKLLVKMGVSSKKITEIGWDESVEIEGIQITGVSTQHDTSRYGIDKNQFLWCGYILNDGNHQLFYSGDGGYTDQFKEVYRKYGTMDVALMECGQYNVRWHNIHCFPEETVQASLDLNAQLAIPMHYGAYCLSDHYYLEPALRFKQRAIELGLNYRIMEINESIVVK